MNELDELEKLIFYLETTSLEPHDDYTTEFTYKEQKMLYKYITKLVNDKTKLQNNWNELKKFIEERLKEATWSASGLHECQKKMQELEQDKDENN